MLATAHTIFLFKPICFLRKRNMLFLFMKWYMTKHSPINIEMIVAIAAPFIPHSNQKMKIGAIIMLAITPISIVYIAF